MPAIVAVFFWVVLCCVVAGFAVWLLGQLTQDATITKIGRVAVIVLLVIVIVWLVLDFTGLPPLPGGHSR